jgi:hypothetical protein
MLIFRRPIMARAKRTSKPRETVAKERPGERALAQPGHHEEDEDAAVSSRRLPERMPQWRTGNPNNSGIAGGVMERLEERWQEEEKKVKVKR